MSVEVPVEGIIENKDPIGWSSRILIGTPTRGPITMDWHQARMNMLVPPNWGQVSICPRMSPLIPKRFQVADAQNIIVREVVEKGYEWLVLLEDDVLAPPNFLVKLDEYMREAKVPVVSGLYYTKGEPSNPLIYRGRGTGSFLDWKLGDVVKCDGVPTGALLVHNSLLKVMWEDAEVYQAGSEVTRKVFNTGREYYMDPKTGVINTQSSTSDLDWCDRVIKHGYLEKAGWPEYKDDPHPFIVDTSIQCYHTTLDGQVYPPQPYGSKPAT